MRQEDIYELIGVVDELDEFRRKKDTEDIHAQAALWARVLERVPREFALDHVISKSQQGETVRSPSAIAAAWKAETDRRLAEVEHELEPPAEIADDTEKWQQWLIQARKAVSCGSSAREARRQADHAVGADRMVESELNEPVDAEESKQRLRSMAQNWTLRRLTGGE